MNREQVEQAAFQAISSGLNCAESVLHAVGPALGVNADGALTRAASCFGGGVGRSKRELCGALAGGLIALGLMHGRGNGDASCEAAYDLGADFRDQFIALHGASACGDLLARFGEQRDWRRCRALTAQTAGLLFELAQRAG